MIPRYRVFAKAGVKAVYGGWHDTAQMFYEIRDIDFYDEEVTVWGCHHKDCGICGDTYKMEEVEIMMSTGLKDKNGVEIFEGDIVVVSKGFTNIIRYSVNEGSWKLRPTDKQWACSYFSNYENTAEWEIIGNIYENQELLESTDD